MPDATGRQTPREIAGSDFNVEADLVIKALGFDPEDLPEQFGAQDLDVTRWGTVKIDYRTMMSTLDGVFAAGDIVRGASLVVWAIRDGRDAADSIDAYIKAKSDGNGRGRCGIDGDRAMRRPCSGLSCVLAGRPFYIGRRHSRRQRRSGWRQSAGGDGGAGAEEPVRRQVFPTSVRRLDRPDAKGSRRSRRGISEVRKRRMTQ